MGIRWAGRWGAGIALSLGILSPVGSQDPGSDESLWSKAPQRAAGSTSSSACPGQRELWRRGALALVVCNEPRGERLELREGSRVLQRRSADAFVFLPGLGSAPRDLLGEGGWSLLVAERGPAAHAPYTLLLIDLRRRALSVLPGRHAEEVALRAGKGGWELRTHDWSYADWRWPRAFAPAPRVRLSLSQGRVGEVLPALPAPPLSRESGPEPSALRVERALELLLAGQPRTAKTLWGAGWRAPGQAAARYWKELEARAVRSPFAR